MNEVNIVDARGMACPRPVVMAKAAVESHDSVMVIVDNETAVENVKRLGLKMGCDVAVAANRSGDYEIRLARKTVEAVPVGGFQASGGVETIPGGPFVLVIADEKMGRGDDQLGAVLMKAFINTMAEQSEKPDVIIFYNTGVRLTVQGSSVLDDLRGLAGGGTEILVCGTCLNYFEIKEQLAVGSVSNMFDITAAMSSAGRLVCP